MPHKDLEARRAYRQANKEKDRVYRLAYLQANKEKISARTKVYRLAYYKANEQKVKKRVTAKKKAKSAMKSLSNLAKLVEVAKNLQLICT